MKKKAAGRFGNTGGMRALFLCFAVLGLICGGMRVQAAGPDRENRAAGQEAALKPDVSGNSTVSGNAPGGQDPSETPTVPEKDTEKEQRPVVSNWNINAAPVSYGQRLNTSVLSGNPVDAAGNPVKGTFSWEEPEKIMLTVGEVSTGVLFTPETVDAAGQVRQGKPVLITYWVTVEKGVPFVSQWCRVRCKDTIYDGDTPGEVTDLQGGRAFYETAAEGKRAKESNELPGKFVWENAGQKLETGTRKCELVFVPSDENLYQRVYAEVELEVLPRPVDLQLELSETVVGTGEKILLTASAEKTQKLQTLEGKVRFRVQGEAEKEEIGEAELTESGSGWTAKAEWTADQPGSYRFYAEYIPEDPHTAAGKTGEKGASVVQPISRLITEELQTGREGIEYRAQLETDASGEFSVRYQLEDGALPDGLKLKENSGEISGTPKQAGEFAFTVSATEKKVTVRRQYQLVIEEKLIFSVHCSDIGYGEKLKALATVSPETEFRYALTFEGRGETVYENSEQAPSQPGAYRVSVKIEEPAEYEGQELYQDFTIRKAVPKLQVNLDPMQLEAGRDCTVSIELSNPFDPGLKENLPTVGGISVSFDKDVEIIQALSGENGSYTLVFRVKQALAQDVKIRCSVSAGENSCYRSAETFKDVTLLKKEEPQKEEPEKEDEEKKSSSKDHKYEEPEQKSEPEAVKKTPEEVEAEFWQDVIFRIYGAQEKGETVTMNAKGHGSLPDKVLDALRQHDKVTLALVWEGDMIVIPAGKAPAYEKEHKTWTLAELSKRYPLIVPEAPKQTAEQPKQETAQQPTASASDQSAEQTSQQAKKDPALSGQSGNEKENQSDHAGDGETSEAEAPETESKEAKPELSDVLKMPETIPAMEEVQEGSTIDWFLVAAGVCAVCAVIVAALAVAMVIKERNEE